MVSQPVRITVFHIGKECGALKTKGYHFSAGAGLQMGQRTKAFSCLHIPMDLRDRTVSFQGTGWTSLDIAAKYPSQIWSVGLEQAMSRQ